MKKIALLLVIVINAFSGFGQNKLEKEITQLFQSELEKESTHNAFLKVYSKSRGINLQFEGGNFKNDNAISFKNPFYTASIGKTFTATAIALLKEKNQIYFSDKIGKYLSKDILKRLHIFNGIDYSTDITIAQLLQHTSGLPDYFEDSIIDGSPNMIEQLFIDPSRYWSPEELIQFTKQKMKPLFAPGKGYHYTDTEYVLLGLIVEEVSGLELHEFFKQFIFKPLKMNNTYMNLKSLPIDETFQMAEVFVGNEEVSSFKSLSADWAGGAIVSTVADLITFQESLFTDKLLLNKTFKAMQHWIPETQGMYYGFGLRKIVLDELHPTLPKLEIIGHSGSTGSFLYYCPSLDVYVAGTLNQTEAVKSSVILMANVLNVILNSN